MHWLVGMDEAGYGPNLGPFVLTSVAVRAPDGAAPLDELLRKAVRRAHEPIDGRLLIDDSKAVNVGPNGLAKLERGVLAVSLKERGAAGWTLGDHVAQTGAGESLADLTAEAWFDRREAMPVAVDPSECDATNARLGASAVAFGVSWGPVRSAVLPAPRFNALLERWDNKASVEASSVIELLQEARSLPGDEPISVAVDRLGGRTYYAGLIQTAFPDGWVQALEETPARCRYQVLGLEREISLSFQPKAESEHLAVALASMASKYLREVCMMQFNRFWQRHVPGLKPTAGYPLDAKRFFDAIRPAMETLGIGAERVWRRK